MIRRLTQQQIAKRALPPYRGILALDAVSFSGNRSSYMPDLSAAVQDSVKAAFHLAGLDEIWADRRASQGTGDGLVLGFLPRYLPFVLNPFLDALQLVLEEQDEKLRARDRELRLRLRVSVNVGPVPDDGDELRDRIGRPTNDTFRLLDSVQLRRVLAQSNPDVTLTAAIVSQRVYEDVVRAGYAGLHADRFEPVIAEVESKNFAQAGWIYVPKPSRHSSPDSSAAPGASSAADAPGSENSPRDNSPRESARRAERRNQTNTFHGDVGSVVNTDDFSGSQTFNFGPGR